MKLRFFCDLCGTEVPRNTVRCPSCGRYFTAVQCPRCGFRGEEKDFAQGCPRCGYMSIPKTAEQGGKEKPRRSRRGSRRRRAAPAAVSFRREPEGSAPGAGASGPPAAVYRLIGVVLTVILIGLLLVLLLR